MTPVCKSRPIVCERERECEGVSVPSKSVDKLVCTHWSDPKCLYTVCTGLYYTALSAYVLPSCETLCERC